MGVIAGCLGMALSDTQTEEMLGTMIRRCPEGVQSRKISAGMLFEGKDRGGGTTLCAQGETARIVFSGRLNRTASLLEELRKLGHPLENPSSAQLALCAYEHWGRNCLSMLSGPFAFAVWESRRKRLFFARDQMGMEPLFYRIHGGTFLFASEMKTILAAPGVRAELDENGAAELILFGPGRIPGSGIFRDIRQLEPGCCGTYEDGKLTVSRYWKLKDREHRETVEETAEVVGAMVRDAIGACSEGCEAAMLSGGLDSSLISAVCAGSLQKTGTPLHTFSVDYLNNASYFQPGKFQPESDEDYIREMVEFLNSTHHTVTLQPEDLVKEMEDATRARDLPGMGDVDFSLMAFCRKISATTPVVLSGECADELFGGYPWYRDPEIRETSGFPWAQNTWRRSSLLAHNPGDCEDRILEACRKTCREADILPGTEPEERRIKEMMNLNLHWFMQTLLERNDRMRGSLEIRVPFCDYRLAEYLYGIPWAMKDYGGREKGLLRHGVKGLLPERVRLRRKSPYPKTLDPQYEALVSARLRRLLTEESPLWYLIDRKAAARLMQEDCPVPWYGQLMRKPQVIAYLLQIEFWLREYKIVYCF